MIYNKKKGFMAYNVVRYNNNIVHMGISRYKLKISKKRRGFGLFFGIVAILPNGLFFVCMPICYTLLTNSSLRGLYRQIKHILSLSISKIKRYIVVK